MTENRILDVRKLLCPLPVIRLQQMIQKLNSKEQVTLLATDPGVLYDVPTWCKIHGHTVLSSHQTKTEIEIKIETA